MAKRSMEDLFENKAQCENVLKAYLATTMLDIQSLNAISSQIFNHIYEYLIGNSKSLEPSYRFGKF